MLNFGDRLIIITNLSPIFKGSATLFIGVLALFFALYMKKKGEPEGIGIKVFIGLSIFIIIYGLYILLFRPDWWLLPY
jgi:hypothetical protein